MSISSSSRYFPPISEASADGLLGIGGSLEVDWLLDAYRHGIFPWPADGDLLAWWSPDPRAVLQFDQLRVSRRLARTCRTGRFTVTRDQDFAGVIQGCRTAQDRRQATWITAEIVDAYSQLHAQGFAHSVEVWQDGRLAGGLYGVALGGVFSAESMFYNVRDASKVAVVHLVGHLARRGFRLLDIQQLTPHMERMGARAIPRWEFLRRIEAAVDLPISFDKKT